MLYDKDIREPLFEFLENSYGKVRLLEEQVMGQSRADVVMVVPGALYGIEIKSDADTYARLKRQTEDYDLYYDYNLIVVGTSHAAHVEEHVPQWWGIITVEQEGEQTDFYFLRKPSVNPKLDWQHKIEILWRPELAHIQELNRMYAYKQKSKRFVADKIVETVPHDLLAIQVSEELFERDYTKIWETIQAYRKENGQKPRRRKRRRRRKCIAAK
ncbi:MAG: sce7726 family protein [Lachnospiraceae bacterium]|nr:sce7726 family protein [Lachnospiraceae bacterium]